MEVFFLVALTYLEDPSNAKQAYEHSLALDSENIYTNMNYAVFLYNQGDRQGSSSRLMNFRKHFDAIVQGKGKDIDPEVHAYFNSLFYLEILNIFMFKVAGSFF